MEYAIEFAEMLRNKRIQNAINYSNVNECYGFLRRNKKI